VKKSLFMVTTVCCLTFATNVAARKGLCFSFQGMPQTQLVFEGTRYRFRPGIGVFYTKRHQEVHLILENDFYIRPTNKLKQFWGIGLRAAYIDDSYYQIYATRIIKFSIEPNIGLQYDFNENFAVFGNVRWSAGIIRNDGFEFSYGNTQIGILLYK
jgi:hypothetical protein